MTAAIDPTVFERFIPLNKLSAKGREALIMGKGISQVEIPREVYLFKAGQSVYDTLYVLEGKVELLTPPPDERVQGSVTGGSPECLQPMPNQVPSQISAVAATDVRLLKVDSNLLNSVLAWDQPEPASGPAASATRPANAAVAETSDWMSNFLCIRGFQRVPPENLQSVFMKMDSITVNAGDVVIKQDTEGDYFYVIAEGRCRVSREVPGKPAVKLAEFGPGACLGEDALISGDKRNATITMITPGKLMRLPKQDFVKLLKEPITRPLSLRQAQELIGKGAQWLDVRMPVDRKSPAMAGSTSIPFFILRSRLSTLDRGKTYVVYCENGQQSSVAAYLLCKEGIDAYFLKGGLVAEAAKA
ncbi:MAG TPA: cyclic nucleotide-binding domain-containing protein [Nevskiales bacterium]|nr:cyclic nucleotide-binding domain-containing protein [Nevskiales bacterium]